MSDESAGNQLFWAEEFDLSTLSYPEFLAFFFDRPTVGDKESYDLFRAGIDDFIASSPARVVAHVHAVCLNYSELTKIYSSEQLDQGLWAVFGAAISCEQYLFDPIVDLRSRISCIESMYIPFRGVVAHSAIDKHDSFFWMWWDMILHTFWQMADNYKFDYPGLSGDGKQVLEAMYQTLCRILALDHPACQWSALHGLGHLRHPSGRQTVQSFLDAHRNELTEEDVKWIETCRDGKNM